MILIVSLFAMGCRDNSEEMYKAGYFDYMWSVQDIIMSGVTAKTDTFSIDSVNLQLYYGLYDVAYGNNLDGYRQEPEDKVVFALYICDEEHKYDVANNCEVTDYKNIDNYYFIKEISEDEAASEEYGYTHTYRDGVEYNHSETLTIPKEFLNKDKGTFLIKLVNYIEPKDESDNYYSLQCGSIWLDYEKTKNGKVKITSLQKD